MPQLTIYLPRDLYRQVQAYGIDKSAVCQRAFAREVAKCDRASRGDAPWPSSTRASREAAADDGAQAS